MNAPAGCQQIGGNPRDCHGEQDGRIQPHLHGNQHAQQHGGGDPECLSWRLTLTGDPDTPLNGELTGATVYTLEGVGTALGSTKHGPTGGYYIKQAGQAVASVQTTGKRQVVLAPGAMADQLIAAAAVLLLIDESVRDLD